MENFSKIKIAFEGNISFNNILKPLEKVVLDHKLQPLFYIGPFDNYQQDVLDEKSGLKHFKPDFTCLILDARQVLKDIILNPMGKSSRYRKEKIEYLFAEIKSFIEYFCCNITGKLLLHNFVVPDRSVLGIADVNNNNSVKLAIQRLNICLAEEAIDNPNVYIVDLDAMSSRIGKSNITEERLYYYGKFLFNKSFVDTISAEYIKFFELKHIKPRKCFVLDLDNTLWGGVIGEDGIAGIHLGDDPPGNCFKEFQRLLEGFYHRGIILAINSRNNPKDAWECIEKHPHMVLKRNHFAAAQINWEDKVANLRRLSAELNIGLESFIFIDDDSFNREMVRKILPMVQVIDLPADPSEYINCLLDEAQVDTLTITEEDAKRGEYYRQDKIRTDLARNFSKVEDYLRSLNISVLVKLADKYSFSRVAQLTLRTNQFNMTTKRYDKPDIVKLASHPQYKVYTLAMKDRFGDAGIVGCSIIEIIEKTWRLDTFLLSCRVIGRGCEDALLAVISEEAHNYGATQLVGEFIPTKKNKPAGSFFPTKGFVMKCKEKDCQIWEFDLQKNRIEKPGHIKII